MMLRSDAARLPRGDGAVHLLAALDERPKHGAQERPRGRGRDAAGGRLRPGCSRRSSTTAGSSWRSSPAFVVGVPLSRVPLTAVPQRTALSHAFGGLAAGLVGTAKYYLWVGEGPEQLTTFRMTAIVAEIILGFLTFTGSLMAAGKLQEIKWIPQRPVTYPLQNVVNIGLLALAVLLGVLAGRRSRRAAGPRSPSRRSSSWRWPSACCSSSRSAARTCRP